MGPRMAHFWNFCANVLIRVRLWSHGFATSQYGLTLLDLSFWSKIPCWQDGKWRNSEEKIKDRWHVLLEFLLQKIEGQCKLHKPPKDPEIKKKWFNFVVKTRESVSKWNTVYVLCSDHFTEDDYTIIPSQFGLLTSGETNVRFRRTLKRGLVTSIYPIPSEEQLVQKEKQFRTAKSRGITIPKTARPSLASIKKKINQERAK